MAITAFVNAQLYEHWNRPSSELRRKYPEVSSFDKLLRTKLKGLKAALNELCSQKKIQPFYSNRADLWRQLNDILKRTRDFFVHPNPEGFDDFMKVASEKNTWAFPSDVASGVIRYFYEQKQAAVPDWLEKNLDFKVIEFSG